MTRLAKLGKSARRVAKLEGCTCDCDVVVRELDEGIFYAGIAHDEGCPLCPPEDEERLGSVTVIPKAQL